MSYYEAEAYASWRTKTAHDGILYRLPTEAEWEYSARGPQDWIYPWGNVFDKSKANTSEAGLHKTLAVGSFPLDKSWVGALDMAGNVQQWAADWFDETYYQHSPKFDPTGPESGKGRVVRGGAHYWSQVDARSAYRGLLAPGSQGGINIGFRLVGVVSAPSERTLSPLY